MLTFSFPTNQPLRVLCLGAHSDDIEIGCGATILYLAGQYPQLEVHWVVFTGQDRRKEEAQNSAGDFLAKVQKKQIVLENFRDGFLPYMGDAVKEYFEALKQQLTPDIIFTHQRYDLHQDHRLLCELSWNTWRNHLILEYEIPKYDGDLGVPNLFVPLTETTARRKTELLMRHFQTQANKDWFTEDTFLGLMRLRGMESKASDLFAEAFYCRKIVLI